MENNMEVRCRFAPAPTGYLHLGTTRTAFINMLFARKMKGKFFIRIEQSDPQSSHTFWIKQMKNDLEWLNITYDWFSETQEFIYQNQRIELYEEKAKRLLDSHFAFKDSSHPGQIAAIRLKSVKELINNKLLPLDKDIGLVLEVKYSQKNIKLDLIHDSSIASTYLLKLDDTFQTITYRNKQDKIIGAAEIANNKWILFKINLNSNETGKARIGNTYEKQTFFADCQNDFKKVCALHVYTIKVYVKDEFRKDPIGIEYERTALHGHSFRPILINSNRQPMYNFASVVDDIEMNITHIIRGNDLIQSLRVQAILYKLFKKKPPIYFHTGLLAGEGDEKISKSSPIDDWDIWLLKNSGYLPQSIHNSIVPLPEKYSLDKRLKKHILTLQDMEKHFDIMKVGTKKINVNKTILRKMNHRVLYESSEENVYQYLIGIRNQICSDSKRKEKLTNFEKRIANVYKNRSYTLLELAEQVKKLASPKDNEYILSLLSTKVEFDMLNNILEGLKLTFEKISDTNTFELKTGVEYIQKQYPGCNSLNSTEIKSLIQEVLLIILTSSDEGPDIESLLYVFGKKNVLAEIKTFLKFLNKKIKMKKLSSSWSKFLAIDEK